MMPCMKQMSKTLQFLRDHKIDSLDHLHSAASEAAGKRDSLLASIQTSEKRLAEIAALKKHIINYSKTRSTYEAYRKAGYSKKFIEAHREELTIHKAAEQAFHELGVRKIPKVKELSTEYAEILSGKKAAYAEYRKTRDEAQELALAERNIATCMKQSEMMSRIGSQKKKPINQNGRRTALTFRVVLLPSFFIV